MKEGIVKHLPTAAVVIVAAVDRSRGTIPRKALVTSMSMRVFEALAKCPAQRRKKPGSAP